jgi:hypothetical protein
MPQRREISNILAGSGIKIGFESFIDIMSVSNQITFAFQIIPNIVNSLSATP